MMRTSPNVIVANFGARIVNPPLASQLTPAEQGEALRLFREGLDTVEIARLLQSTPAAAANGLAAARDRARSGRG